LEIRSKEYCIKDNTIGKTQASGSIFEGENEKKSKNFKLAKNLNKIAPDID
jgi:hypothetical protein